MDDLDLLVDLHGGSDRQGPGGNAETRLALTLSGLRNATDLTIADIGCGTGASTLVLASDLDARITAVDLFPVFLDRLMATAGHMGLADQITPLATSMDDLPFAEASLDAIWSEGAIYNIGFETGLRDWRRFLKPGGILAVSELTWLTAERPDELTGHWMSEYPQVATAPEKLSQLQEHGYQVLGYFPLPKSSWLDHYYLPLISRFDTFLARHEGNEVAQQIIDAEKREIALYERFSDYVSYGFYIARKLGD